jgi:hypothetical protein
MHQILQWLLWEQHKTIKPIVDSRLYCIERQQTCSRVPNHHFTVLSKYDLRTRKLWMHWKLMSDFPSVWWTELGFPFLGELWAVPLGMKSRGWPDKKRTSFLTPFPFLSLSLQVICLELHFNVPYRGLPSALGHQWQGQCQRSRFNLCADHVSQWYQRATFSKLNKDWSRCLQYKQ